MSHPTPSTYLPGSVPPDTTAASPHTIPHGSSVQQYLWSRRFNAAIPVTAILPITPLTQSQILRRDKTHHFRRTPHHRNLTHLFLQSAGSVKYVMQIGAACTCHDGDLIEHGVGNVEFNSGVTGFKFAYPIVAIWEVVRGISGEELKEGFGVEVFGTKLVYCEELRVTFEHGVGLRWVHRAA